MSYFKGTAVLMYIEINASLNINRIPCQVENRYWSIHKDALEWNHNDHHQITFHNSLF